MKNNRSRNAIALMWVLVVLSVLGATTSAATWQFFAARRALEARQNKLQATWLARSATEFAADKLLNDPNGYLGEKVEFIPDSQVTIVVEKMPDKQGIYRIVSEVRFPVSGPNAISMKTVRIATLKTGGGKSAVELTPDELK